MEDKMKDRQTRDALPVQLQSHYTQKPELLTPWSQPIDRRTAASRIRHCPPSHSLISQQPNTSGWCRVAHGHLKGLKLTGYWHWGGIMVWYAPGRSHGILAEECCSWGMRVWSQDKKKNTGFGYGQGGERAELGWKTFPTRHIPGS